MLLLHAHSRQSEVAGSLSENSSGGPELSVLTETFLMKRYRVVKVDQLLLNFAILLACGCAVHLDPLCNVSIGSTHVSLAKNSDCMLPGLVTFPDGNLLAAEECDGAVMTQMSADNGMTWKPNTPMFFQPLASTVALSMLPSGKLFLSTSESSSVGVPAYAIGTIGPGHPRQLCPPVTIKTPGWTAGCWAVSPLVSAANGNLLWPVWCYNNKTRGLPGTSTVLVSADGGVTWPKQVVVGDSNADGRDYDESAGAAYQNGDIVMIIRHTPNAKEEPRGSWWRSKSTDEGLTWSSPVKVADFFIAGRPTLALLPSGGLLLLGRAMIGNKSTTGFGTSWDEGLNFSLFANLEADSKTEQFDEYDAISLLSNGTIGVVTSHNDHGDGNFRAGTYNVDYRNLIDNCPVAPPPSKQSHIR